LDDGSHGFLALLFSFGLQLEALRFELLDLGVDIFEGNNGYFVSLNKLVCGDLSAACFLNV